MMLEAMFIQEPSLLFGSKGRALDPKIGLLSFGPSGFLSDSSPEFKNVTVGIIGDRESIDELLGWLGRIEYPIANTSSVGAEFPGLHPKGPLRFQIRTDPQWQEIIPREDIKDCVEISSRVERVIQAIRLFEGRLESLTQKDPTPDLALCVLPDSVLKACLPLGQRHPRIILDRGQSYEYHNFHHALKVLGIKNNIPTQLIQPRTLRGRGTQDPATVAWNLSVAIYYKASGIPWKLAELEQGTCYAGISFFREWTEEALMGTSIAQIFLHTGESLVLRGESFEWDEKDKTAHLTCEQATQLTEKILRQYSQTHISHPKRLVLHKTSEFNQDELAGFAKGASQVPKKDFVAIRNTDIRFYRVNGDYPVLRGTTLYNRPHNEYYLYATGYLTAHQTYPGPRVPVPLLIHPGCDDTGVYLDTPIKTVLGEILALTKLDWNTSAFCGRTPVTLDVAQKVGGVLSEPNSKNVTPRIHYRFYM